MANPHLEEFNPQWDFDDLHREGARRFGPDWVVVNMAILDAVQRRIFDPSLLGNKLLLSTAAYGVCALRDSEEPGAQVTRERR